MASRLDPAFAPCIAAPAWQRLAAAALLLAVGLLAACTRLPAAAPRVSQAALSAPADAPLAVLAAASLSAQPPQGSGLQLLADGADALATRLALVRLARRSLDLQYYQIAADAAGLQLLRELHAAAQRGVRVRLLVDDLHVGELQPMLAALDDGEQFQVRLFNPLPSRRGSVAGRMLASMHEFGRVNRRMHNKLFIADHSVAVTGGRNIGDEYFMRGAQANFFDMDVIVAGAVLPELSAHFDAFWNHALAYEARSLLGAPTDAAALQPLLRAPRPAAGAQAAAPGSVVTQIAQGRLKLKAAQVSVFADAPDKASGRVEGPGLAMERSLQLMQAAQHDVLIASPYFVPGPTGLALMRQAIDRGIRVSVLTNSFSTTDEPLAHQGYARYRLDMLRMGVSLAELGPAGSRPGAEAPSSLSRLHAKLAVVDRRWLLIGSMNMDLRSSRLNTELKLAIDSTELAAAVLDSLHRQGVERHFQLRLDATGQRIQWLVPEQGHLRLHEQEPHAHWLSQFQLGLMSMFIDETQL